MADFVISANIVWTSKESIYCILMKLMLYTPNNYINTDIYCHQHMTQMYAKIKQNHCKLCFTALNYTRSKSLYVQNKDVCN